MFVLLLLRCRGDEVNGAETGRGSEGMDVDDGWSRDRVKIASVGGEGGPRTAVWIREVAKIYYVVKKEEEEKEEE